MFNILINPSTILNKIVISTIVMLLAVTTSIALPTIGRPGCPWSYSGGNEVIYFDCWYCPSQPANLGCYGDCANPCRDAFTYQETEIGSGVYLVKIYSNDGGVIGEFYADGWEDEAVSLPGGVGVKTTFNIVDP